jgi:hypothetical protein
MAFDRLKAEISLLLEQMENQPHTRAELWQQLHDKLNEMRALGLPLPADLADLEEALAQEMRAGARDERET